MKVAITADDLVLEKIFEALSAIGVNVGILY